MGGVFYFPGRRGHGIFDGNREKENIAELVSFGCLLPAGSFEGKKIPAVGPVGGEPS